MGSVNPMPAHAGFSRLSLTQSSCERVASGRRKNQMRPEGMHQKRYLLIETLTLDQQAFSQLPGAARSPLVRSG